MTLAGLFETAAAWNRGMNSALYALVSCEMILNREKLITEIQSELNGDGLNCHHLREEKQALQQLLGFAETAPENVSLSYAIINSLTGEYCGQSH